MENIRVRFAPSPTGLLHVGNARTALFNWLFARQQEGCFVLRVEDTDVERSAPEHEQNLASDLRWLGLVWDEGPEVGGPYGPYRQSQRLDIYAEYSRRLMEQERAYPCFCTPDELAAERKKMRDAGTTPVYSGRCRSLSPSTARARIASGERPAIRLRTPRQGRLGFEDVVRGRLDFDLKLVGDPILLRPSGLPAYNYAVVVDDHLMRISHVIRGEDHIANTVRQILTFQALDFDPPVYAHLSMVMGEDNTRLSKRHGATAVQQFRASGVLPESLFNYLALLGWAPPGGREYLEQEELVRLFDLNRVSRSAAIFDYDKLRWLNRKHMQALTSRDRAVRAAPFLQDAGYLPAEMTDAHWSWLEKAVEALLEKVDNLAELNEHFRQLFDFSPQDMEAEAREILQSECGTRVVQSLSRKLSGREGLDFDGFAALTREIKEETGCKGKELFHPIRVALTAQASGLDLDKLIPLVEAGVGLPFPRPLLTCAQRVEAILRSFP